jgi:hypothetical protein
LTDEQSQEQSLPVPLATPPFSHAFPSAPTVHGVADSQLSPWKLTEEQTQEQSSASRVPDAKPPFMHGLPSAPAAQRIAVSQLKPMKLAGQAQEKELAVPTTSPVFFHASTEEPCVGPS